MGSPSAGDGSGAGGAATAASSDRVPRLRLRDVMHAGARGVVAAMAMTGLRAMTGGLGLVKQTPPQAIARQGAPGLLRRVPRRRRDATIEAVHWAYGGLGGMAYGALPHRWRRPPWGSLVYGTAVWVGFEFALAPALGLTRSGGDKERAAIALDHLLYGLVLSEIRPAHKAQR